MSVPELPRSTQGTAGLEPHGPLKVWRVVPRAAAPRLHALVSTRLGGCSPPPYDSLNLGLSTGDDPERVARNRRALREACALPGEPFLLHQVHGAVVVEAGDRSRGARADGSWTDAPGHVLALGLADCMPVFLWDPVAHRLALLHAGWRGTAAGILRRGVETLAGLGSPPEILQMALGPSIGPCCYEVGPEVARRFPEAVLTPSGSDRWRLDLRRAARLEAASLGVRVRPDGEEPPCTACHTDVFYSHRKQGPRTGRHWAIAWFEAAAPVDDAGHGTSRRQRRPASGSRLAGGLGLVLASLSGLLGPLACDRGVDDPAAAAVARIQPARIDPAGRFLTQEKLAGRHFASPDADSTVRYLVQRLEALGIPAVSRAEDLLAQGPACFVHVFGAPLQRLGRQLRLDVEQAGRSRRALVGDDYLPLVHAVDAEVTGRVVRLDTHEPRADPRVLRDRVVVARLDVPASTPPAARAAHLYAATRRLGQAGAAAVLFELDEAWNELASATYPRALPPRWARAAFAPRAVQLHLAPDRLARAAQSTAWHGRMPRTVPALVLQPRWAAGLRDGDRVGLHVDLQTEVALGQNVLVVFPGRRNPRRAFFVGAHFDHTGVNPLGNVLPGADDNASGVAALLEVAAGLRDAGPTGATVVLALLTGEMHGAAGGAALLEDLGLLFGELQPYGYLGLDAVGGGAPQALHVFGADEAAAIASALQRYNRRAALQAAPFALVARPPAAWMAGLIDGLPATWAHGSTRNHFAAAGIPAVVLNDGLDPTERYGRPSDTWERVDTRKIARVARLALRVVLDQAAAPPAGTASPAGHRASP